MPIRGLSDRESVQPSPFKEIGRLRKGAQKQGNRVGRDLEHFRFTAYRDRQDIAAAFYEAYGDEPTQFEVYFPYDTMEENFHSFREQYGQNGLCKLRCDGENWVDWIEGDRHIHEPNGKPCTYPYKDVDNRCPKCPLAYVGKLSVILPKMWMAGHVGIVLVLTSSVNDIANLSAKLVQWEPLRGKPFLLWRQMDRIGVPIQGQRAAKEMSLLHLERTEEEMRRLFLESREQPVLLEESVPAEVEFDEPPVENFAEFGADVLYDEPEVVEEEPDTEPEQQPVVLSAPPAIEAPADLTRENIVHNAVHHLPFDNIGQVMGAMLAEYGPTWSRDSRWDVQEAWGKLQKAAQNK